MCPKALLLIFLTAAIIPCEILSQNFSRVDAGFPVAHKPAAAWADVDNDGDLDLFISGMDGISTPVADVFRNDGSTFTPLSTSIIGLYSGSCAFGDYNNDGLADLLVSGSNGSTKYTRVYRNDGGGAFTDIGAGLAGTAYGDVAWGDVNNDGWADLFISGENNLGQPICLLYINNEGISFTDANAGLSGHMLGELALSDLDRDGDIDLAMNGIDNSQNPSTKIYINTDGNFTQMGTGIIGLSRATIAWGDFNNDTWPDLLITGTDVNTNLTTRVYKNNAGSSFSLLAGQFYGIVNGSGIWGDFNNDGDLDFLIGGKQVLNAGDPPPMPAIPAGLQIYHNQGNEQFVRQPINLNGVENNEIICGDYDNDSDLDLIVCGEVTNPIGTFNVNAVIYRNGTISSNNPPSAPSGLSYTQTGNDVSLSWNPSTDDKTPSTGLNYNLRIGSTNVNMDVMSALANLNNGFRRIVIVGNTLTNTSWDIYGLDIGAYYASVQAIDPSYSGSEFSADINFELAPTATFSVMDSSCVEEEVVITYTGNASSTAQYDWDFDGAIVVSGSGQGPITVYWDTQGTKTISLAVTQNGATSAPIEQDIEVIGNAQEPGIITGPSDVCQGETSDYAVPPIANAEIYEWFVSPAEAGTTVGNTNIAQVEWSLSYMGNAYVYVRGTNYCGEGPYSDSLDVVLNPLPGQADKPIGPTDLCLNSSNTTYTTTAAVGALGYQWTLVPQTAGLIFNNGLEAEIDWDNSFSGQANLIVSAFNACGAGPVSEALIIDIAIPPQANAGDHQFIDLGTSTQLSGSASGGSGSYSYYWMPDTLLVNPGIAEPTTIPLLQSVQFLLSVTDTESGCSGIDQAIVTVIGGPLNLVVSAEPDTICEGDSAQLLALGGGGSGNYTYEWTSNPPGFTSNTITPVVYPSVTTTYYAVIVDGTESMTDSVLVTVLSQPAAAGIISGPEEVCIGSEQVLYEIDPVPDATAYLWELSEGLFGSSNTNSILVNFPTNVSNPAIQVIPANACGLGQPSSIEIEMISFPDAPAKPFGPDSLCTTTDTIAQYQISESVAGASSYEWELLPEEAGTIYGEGIMADVHWVKNWIGQATIRIRAMNSCGSSYWSEVLNVHTFSCLGIHDFEKKLVSIMVYPNPTNGQLNIEFTGIEAKHEFRLYIRNLYGRLLFSDVLDSGIPKSTVDISHLSPGMYILSFEGGDGIWASEKLILSR